MIAFPASLLILSGKSADNLPLRDATVKFHDEGVEIHARIIRGKGDTQRYVDKAHQLNITMVIAGGGDGTIDEVSIVLIQSQDGNTPTLGILPLGTVNGFAASVDIPDDPDKALKLATAANATAIDVVQVNDKTCFINMVIGGFGTCTTTETPEKLKAALGGILYFTHRLMRVDTLRPGIRDIRGEDFHWQGKALVIGIGNGHQVGGGQQLCPTALISDGLLQLRISTSEELLPGLLSALTQSEDNPSIIEGVSSWFDIRTPHEITLNFDGKPLSGQEFHTEILPVALCCRLPSGCPLLR